MVERQPSREQLEGAKVKVCPAIVLGMLGSHSEFVRPMNTVRTISDYCALFAANVLGEIP
jgi:hypothetical protein